MLVSGSLWPAHEGGQRATVARTGMPRRLAAIAAAQREHPRPRDVSTPHVDHAPSAPYDTRRT